MPSNVKIKFKALAAIIIITFVFGFNDAFAEEALDTIDESATINDLQATIPDVVEPISETDDKMNTLFSQPGEFIIGENIAVGTSTEDEASSSNEEIIPSAESDSGVFTVEPGNTELGDGETGLMIEAPAAASATSSDGAVTGMWNNASDSSLSILTGWIMSGEKDDGIFSGNDDSDDNGTQLLPSGLYQISKNIAVCALVYSLSEPEDAGSVQALIKYPEETRGADDSIGCGYEKSKIDLVRLLTDESRLLVCDRIRNNNNNLLFVDTDDSNVSYEQVCGSNGYFAQDRVAVLCGETALAYNDPAGYYTLEINISSSPDASSSATSNFQYLEITTFENDFNSVQYGTVKRNEWKDVLGDSVWGNASPTIRNTGNTRLTVKIKQNDFGFNEKRVADRRIFYHGRVGDAAYTDFSPDKSATLDNPLELGAITNIDFGVLVKHFPSAENHFQGEIIMTAESMPYLACQ